MPNPIPSSRQLSQTRSLVNRSLHFRYAEQARLNEELATGLKVRRSSDDPTAYGIARRLDTVINRYDQYQRSIDSATAWASSSQDTLDDVATLMTTAYEEAIRGANDTVGTEGRSMIADRVDGVLEQIVAQLNTKGADGFLFGGTNTTTKPFLMDNATGADGAGVSYYGNATEVQRNVGEEMRMSVGVTGSRFTTAGVTESIGALRDALNADDTAAIETALADVITGRDFVIDLTAEVGVKADRLSDMSSQFAELQIRNEAHRSGVQDADLAKTISNIQRSQTGLQAAMQAVASLYQNSILNYLR
ncbi:MAG: flagellar hook-associated protein 3 FlgL [Rhodothermales bacterium]|jgi:flagellar hook-associated protein 3 FlgL